MQVEKGILNEYFTQTLQGSTLIVYTLSYCLNWLEGEQMEITERLTRQLAFIIEVDKVKQIFRKTQLMDGSRHENDAEHAWHLAILAMVLREYANDPKPDLFKVIKMVIIHDLVEIDAGDTFIYDEKGNQSKATREEKAADRIFGLLPNDQRDEFRMLWDEFEQRQTPEARFAAALDRFEPVLQNYHTQGHAWREHNVKSEMTFRINKKICEGSETLWQYTQHIIEDAVSKGWLEM